MSFPHPKETIMTSMEGNSLLSWATNWVCCWCWQIVAPSRVAGCLAPLGVAAKHNGSASLQHAANLRFAQWVTSFPTRARPGTRLDQFEMTP